MAVQTIIVESALWRADVQEEIEDLDSAKGGEGAAQGISITFLSVSINGEEELEILDSSSVIGQSTIVNYRSSGESEFSTSYVYEAIIRTPEIRSASGQTYKLLNNYVHCDRNFKITADGKQFSIRGIYYCQQNQTTTVCAHACLKMLLNTVQDTDELVTTRFINDLLHINPPIDSLQIQQISDVINHNGLKLVIHSCKSGDSGQYLQVLHSFLDSGFSALLVFTTAHPVEHVVYVCGHTLNTDEWHPQALPAYSGAPGAPYYASSAWVDHFIVQDDNFGPYFSLSSRSLAVDPEIQASLVIGILPTAVESNPLIGQVLSPVVLGSVLPQVKAHGSGKWFEYMTSRSWSYILRTMLMKREDYIDHLSDIEAYNGSRLSGPDIQRFQSLPDLFWCTEFTLPNLFAGNKSKLGEVLVEATTPIDQDAPQESVLAMRGPSLSLVRQPLKNFGVFPSSIDSHCPIYRTSDHDHEW